MTLLRYIIFVFFLNKKVYISSRKIGKSVFDSDYMKRF